jgi:naringenin degradation protein FdeH
MPKNIRRVVTGHNAEGKSVFIFDGNASNVLIPPKEPKVAMMDLWLTRSTPASNAGNEDAAAGPISLPPPKNGSVFRIVELPPDSERDYSNFKTIDTEGALRGGNRHPAFHKTNTIDYIIILEGEVWALMDEGEVLMKAGDVLIQRGTNHAWSNRSDKPVIIVGVMIEAAPV